MSKARFWILAVLALAFILAFLSLHSSPLAAGSVQIMARSPAQGPAATPEPSQALGTTADDGPYLPLLYGPTADPNITPSPTDPAEPGLTLYLHNGYTLQLAPQTGLTTWFLYPSSPVQWQRPLDGDIQGSDYTFSLRLASSSTSLIEATILAGNEQLAEQTFSVSSAAFLRRTVTVSGIDPATASGDTLILRVEVKSGANAALQSGPERYDQDSTITIPPVKGP